MNKPPDMTAPEMIDTILSRGDLAEEGREAVEHLLAATQEIERVQHQIIQIQAALYQKEIEDGNDA